MPIVSQTKKVVTYYTTPAVPRSMCHVRFLGNNKGITHDNDDNHLTSLFLLLQAFLVAVFLSISC